MGYTISDGRCSDERRHHHDTTTDIEGEIMSAKPLNEKLLELRQSWRRAQQARTAESEKARLDAEYFRGAVEAVDHILLLGEEAVDEHESEENEYESGEDTSDETDAGDIAEGAS